MDFAIMSVKGGLTEDSAFGGNLEMVVIMAVAEDLGAAVGGGRGDRAGLQVGCRDSGGELARHHAHLRCRQCSGFLLRDRLLHPEVRALV